ncbi:MAG: hypothetical protein KGZ58_06345 [Ignavibacteriales bacterium]|nr:hypothetical protein [Ignavibacteriales bacterium]
MRKKKKIIEKSPTVVTNSRIVLVGLVVVIITGVVVQMLRLPSSPPASTKETKETSHTPTVGYQNKWLERAFAVTSLFHQVYTPCWEGAYGAIGDAYLFAATNDSSLLRFHLEEHDLRLMCTGTWVDDRAWVCLAEMYWWDFTGRKNFALVEDTKRRYLEARREGRLSSHEGFWGWYNWSPTHRVNERIFTNSNMNQMANVACWLFEATGEQNFLDDALLVWNGDKQFPGIIQTLYKGNGKWEGKPGLAAFGKQLPWEGAEYCAIGASLFRVTKEKKYRDVVVATAKYITNSANGWLDPTDYFQITMDGNGAFVNYLLDAYALAPEELPDVYEKVEVMLEHVWTNHHGKASVTLHREYDHGIRNGWNPNGGEDGYGVDEVGTVHAQGEAARAFGMFAYFANKKETEKK